MVKIFVFCDISSLFSIQSMVAYFSQGGKKNGMQAFTTPDEIAAGYQAQGATAPPYLYANYNSTAKLNYLMVPILAKFGWNFKNSPLRIYVDTGPFVGFLLTRSPQEKASFIQIHPGNSPYLAEHTLLIIMKISKASYIPPIWALKVTSASTINWD